MEKYTTSAFACAVSARTDNNIQTANKVLLIRGHLCIFLRDYFSFAYSSGERKPHHSVEVSSPETSIAMC